MDLAPLYTTLAAEPQTLLVSNRGQVSVVHMARPANNKASIELFDLGPQVDLAVVVRLAIHLGLIRDDRQLVVELDAALGELEEENAGLSDERRHLRAELAQALEDRRLLAQQLEAQALRKDQLTQSLRAADLDRDELRRQVEALRRALDAAEQAGAPGSPGTPAAAAAAPAKSAVITSEAGKKGDRRMAECPRCGKEVDWRGMGAHQRFCPVPPINPPAAAADLPLEDTGAPASAEPATSNRPPATGHPSAPPVAQRIPMKGRVSDLHKDQDAAADLLHGPAPSGDNTCVCGFHALGAHGLNMHILQANRLLEDEAA